MGKKGGWISAVKKVLTFESKDVKEKKSENSKNKYYKQNETTETLVAIPPASPKDTEKSENEQNMHAYSVAIATAAAAEAAAAAARAAAAEVARLTVAALRSKEEAAAVKIQTAFRAHLARKALRALRGLARLKSMIQGQSVQRQSMITLKCMQTLTRVQTQIRSKRVRRSEENLALQQHFQQKNEREVEKLRVPARKINENLDLQQHIQQKCEKEPEKMKAPVSTTISGEGWNASAASKEQIEAKLQHKEEAAKKRERALVYAYSHQSVRKNPSKPGNPKPENPINRDQITDTFWGWSWLERWDGTRPWEKTPTHDQYPSINDENTSQKTDPTPKTKPSSPTLPPPRASSVGPKSRPVGLKVSGPGRAQPGHQRRYTIGGSLVKKDGDKNPTQKTVSSNGKSRVASRLGNGKTDKGLFGSSRKQLSYSLSSPGERRHSGPGKVAVIS